MEKIKARIKHVKAEIQRLKGQITVYENELDNIFPCKPNELFLYKGEQYSYCSSECWSSTTFWVLIYKKKKNGEYGNSRTSLGVVSLDDISPIG